MAGKSALAAAFLLGGVGFCGAALTLDAIKARIHTVGSAVPGGWNLFSNGELGDHVRFPASTNYHVRVRMWGSPCQGIWPEMALLVDGEQAQRTTVASREPKDYDFQVVVPAGVRTLTVGFLNDAMANGEDRNH